MKKIVLIAFILAAAIIANSCRRDKYIPNVCFKENILPIFISKCGSPGCHNASSSGKQEKYNFTNYEGILKGVNPGHLAQSEIYTKIKGNNPEMPPTGSPQLTAKEIDYIKYWISFGAQNSTCGSTACDTTSYITYNNTIKDIVSTNCLGCHYTGNGVTLVMEDYASVAANGPNIITRITLPISNALHMPQGTTLSDCDIAKIKKWVDIGKPEL